MSYTLSFSNKVKRELARFDSGLAQRAIAKIETLAKNPWPDGCAKIEGRKSAWRVRVGDYRIIYEVDRDKKVVDIVAVKHRREAYDR